MYFVQSFKKESAYPPVDEWIVESEEVHQMWHHRINVAPLPDSRQARHSMHLLDPSLLNIDLDSHSSAIFKDRDTNEVVMVVMRNFCRDKAVLDWLTGIVLENIRVERNIRVRNHFEVSPPRLIATLLFRKKTVAAW